MSTTTDAAYTARTTEPLRRFGAGFVGFTAECGALAILAVSAARASILPRGAAVPFPTAVGRNLDRILMLTVPLVAIFHVGLGSFLAMQAYFGATFVDGIGPVVGVGLVRNLAPLMSAFVLTGVLATLFSGELREHRDATLIDEPEWVPDRDDPGGADGSRTRTEPARLVAARVAAAALAAPLLGLWASGVGIVVGWAVGRSILGVTTPGFFDLFVEMLWVRDVVGLLLKGLIFGAVGGLFACREGLRLADESDLGRATAACRAACLSGAAILFVNSAWFLLFYHAGPAFGPTVLTPPHL